MQAIRHEVRKLRNTDLAVLIEGESGTGKETMARLIHAESPCADGEFVKVNCPAIPATSMDGGLFGYKPVAFGPVNGHKAGGAETAIRGTLFLDDIGELDAVLQAKLLQFLQDGRFYSEGRPDKRFAVRIICATNGNLEQEVTERRFRQDLFYRIKVVSVRMAPLRERSADIPVIADYFLVLFGKKFNCPLRPLPASLLQKMQQYHWPGNIRQLQNLMTRYVVVGSEEVIESELAAKIPVGGQEFLAIPLDRPISLKSIARQTVRETEGRIILQILQANRWNRKRAARALNISYRALLYKMKQAHVVIDGGPADVKQPEEVTVVTRGT